MKFSHIVACSENGVIGRQGQLPWHISEDLKRFKGLTMGHILIMGRKTFESIGRPLPGRYSIVVSRGNEAIPRIATPVRSLDEAYAHAEEIHRNWSDEVFIIGGGEIYAQTLAKVDRIYLTKVHCEIDGDTYYPLEALQDFAVLEEEQLLSHSPACTFSILQRK